MCYPRCVLTSGAVSFANLSRDLTLSLMLRAPSFSRVKPTYRPVESESIQLQYLRNQPFYQSGDTRCGTGLKRGVPRIDQWPAIDMVPNQSFLCLLHGH